MRLIRPSACIMQHSQKYEDAVEIIAEASAQCYNKVLPDAFDEREKYILGRLKSGHESIIEHASVSVKFTVDRGVTHELVRHRLCAFTQESTRYCDYDGEREGGEVKFIIPEWCKTLQPGVYREEEELDSCMMHYPEEESVFFWSLIQAERNYKRLRNFGWKPEQARAILPNAVKANIIVTANMREWRHIFKLRALGMTGRPHPQMLEVMVPLLEEFETTYPVFFADLGVI